MTKRIILSVILALVGMAVWGQSLQDNEYYRKMVELKSLSEKAFEEGDYIEARNLAVESRSYKERSDEWIENQLAAYRARGALVRVKDRLTDASRVNAAVNFPDEFEEGKTLYNQAYSEFYDDKAYIDSLATSNRALAVLSVIKYVPTESILPAFYIVRLLPGNTDCLWNIAGYDFIYDDPWMWRKLYDAKQG